MKTIYVKIMRPEGQLVVMTHIHPEFKDVYESITRHYVDGDNISVGHIAPVEYTYIQPKLYPIIDIFSNMTDIDISERIRHIVQSIYTSENYTGAVKFIVLSMEDMEMEDIRIISGSPNRYDVGVIIKDSKYIVQLRTNDTVASNYIIDKKDRWRDSKQYEIDNFHIVTSLVRLGIVNNGDTFRFIDNETIEVVFDKDGNSQLRRRNKRGK